MAETGLSIQLMGRPAFAIDGRPLVVRSRKAEALLAYLALCPGNMTARSTMTGLLWGEKSEAQARSSLRQTILILNRLFREKGFSGFLARKTELLLLPDSFTTDIADLLDAIADEARLPVLLRQPLSAAQILEGCDDLEEQFSVWLRVQRQAIHDRIRHELEQRLARSDGDEDRIHVAQALLNVDASHEPACRALMELRCRRGDHAGALNAYNNLYRYLEENFDTEPGEATQQLVVAIKLGQVEPSAERPAEAGGRPASVPASVCPRIIIEGIDVARESDASSFAAPVFHHDLIARMVRFREWSVIDDLPQLEERTDIPTYRLRSTALVSGERIKLSLTLLDARTGSYVWGYNYDLESSALFDVQQQIVAHIAMGVNVHVTSQQLARSRSAELPTLDGYQRWLLAQAHHFRHEPADFEQAVLLYQQLIDDHPSFAPAYSSLAQTLNSRHLVFVGEPRTRTVLERARVLARTAQDLDPFDSRAHLCAAWNAMLLEHFDEAERNLRLAQDLNENDPWTAISVATGFAFCGHCDLARSLALRARELGFLTSPVQWGYLTGLWFICGDYAAAAETYRRSGGGFLTALPWAVAAHMRLGEREKAATLCTELFEKASKLWQAEAPASRDNVASWIAQVFPVAEDEARLRLVEGLAGAGLVPA